MSQIVLVVFAVLLMADILTNVIMIILLRSYLKGRQYD